MTTNSQMTETEIEEIEKGLLFKTDEKTIRANEFLNILTEMILDYHHNESGKQPN